MGGMPATGRAWLPAHPLEGRPALKPRIFRHCRKTGSGSTGPVWLGVISGLESSSFHRWPSRHKKGPPEGGPGLAMNGLADHAALETGMRCFSGLAWAAFGNTTVRRPFFKVALASASSISTPSGMCRSKRPYMRSL